ncbi:MAG: hypothetical protein Q8R32_01270 [bacterium]|nr:hypothetical protein [bacterium]
MNKQIVSHLWGVQYRTTEYQHAIFPTRTFKSRWERFLAFIGLATIVLGFSIFPKIAFADPHATFFTDRAQEQLFFNVLAALNQADYVEPPDQPPLDSDAVVGHFISTGEYRPVKRSFFTPPPQIVRDPLTGQIISARTEPIEPNEQRGVELPRIRVRQVTSDDGDVYFRERVERRARTEELRVMLGYIACKAAEELLGPGTAEKRKYCPDSLTGVSPR